MQFEYVDTNCVGDHICYIRHRSKMITHYPSRGIAKDLDDVFGEIHAAALAKQ
jgi:CDP-paratose 2-epimerase